MEKIWRTLVGGSERNKRSIRTASRDMDGCQGAEMTQRGHPQHQDNELSSCEESEEVLYDRNDDEDDDDDDDDKGSSVDVANGRTPPPEMIKQDHPKDEEHTPHNDENQRVVKENEREDEEEQGEEDVREQNREINDILRSQNPGKMLQILMKSISEGNIEHGYDMLKALTYLRAKISMHLLSVPDPCHYGNDEPFYINVSVETIDIRKGPTWRLQVKPSMTIAGMKLKVALLYSIPRCKQRWLIGRKVAADGETVRGNGLLADSSLTLFLSNGQEPTEGEKLLIDEFRKKLLVEGISNIELSFNELEYSKYLDEASSLQQQQQQQQDPSHYDEQQIQYAPTPDDTRYRTMPQNLQKQEHPQEAHQWQPEPAAPKVMPRFYGEENGPGELSPRSLPDYDEQLFYNRQGPPQRGLPFSSMKVQPSQSLPRMNPTRTQVFPPPQLVQSGPGLQLQDPPQRGNQRLQRSGQVTSKKVQRLPKRDQTLNLEKTPGMRRAQQAHTEDDRLKSYDPSMLPSYTNRRYSYPEHQPSALQELEDAKEDIETLFHEKVQSATVRHKKKTHRRHLRRPVDFNTVTPQDDLITAKQQPIPVFGADPLPTAEEVGWVCPKCTLKNPPLIPGCGACTYERPPEYQIPPKGSYIMDEDEARIQESLQRNEAAFQMMQVREEEIQRQNARENRAKLYQATEFNLMVNEAVFECPVCFSEIEPGQGIRLQECLHELCRECCVNHIAHAEGPEVICPYTDGDNACQQTILDRELRQIVGKQAYDKIVERSLKKAEEVSPNTFHCLTPNCKGFCFYDEEHNFFDCPICRRMNCLTCKVVHEGQNCRQYQDDIKLKARNNETAKQTQDALEQLLREGRAMHCPQCGVVIQKKGGCPNMTCSVCRRGFRWTGVDM